MTESQEPIDFTEDHARQVLRDHISIVAKRCVERYGNARTMFIMEQVLVDRDVVRRETTWRIDASLLEQGETSMAVSQGKEYVIAVHPFFEGKEDELPLLVAYHLATVNYGEGVVAAEEAELFAAGILGMEADAYYDAVCYLTDGFLAK